MPPPLNGFKISSLAPVAINISCRRHEDFSEEI